MGVTRDPHGRPDRFKKALRIPWHPGEGQPLSAWREIQISLKYSAKKILKWQETTAWGPHRPCPASQYFTKCSVCNQKQSLCKHISFYNSWYFSLVFLAKFFFFFSPIFNPIVGIFADLRGRAMPPWLAGVAAKDSIKKSQSRYLEHAER